MSSFGEELQKIRKERKLSLKEVAKKGDLSHSYISQIENGKRNAPKPETIHKLAKGLSIDPHLLMQKAGYINPGNFDKQIKLSMEIEKLKGEQVQLTKEIIRELRLEFESHSFEEEIDIIQLLSLKKQIFKTQQYYNKLKQVDKDLLVKDIEIIREFEEKLNEKKIGSINLDTIDIFNLINTEIDLFYSNQPLSDDDKKNIIKFIENFIKG